MCILQSHESQPGKERHTSSCYWSLISAPIEQESAPQRHQEAKVAWKGFLAQGCTSTPYLSRPRRICSHIPPYTGRCKGTLQFFTFILQLLIACSPVPTKPAPCRCWHGQYPLTVLFTPSHLLTAKGDSSTESSCCMSSLGCWTICQCSVQMASLVVLICRLGLQSQKHAMLNTCMIPPETWE